MSLRLTARMLVAALTLTLPACSPEAAPQEVLDAVADETVTQAPDLVDLTVYFRKGRGTDAFLTPVIREVPVSEDLPRTALALLVEGPRPGDPPELAPVLPPTTQVRSLEIDGTTATVDLSRDVLTDAGRLARRPEHEALALAAIADTLTEFPDIVEVRPMVEGQPGGGFWGAWGLPRVLVRDERIIDPDAPGELIPPLDGFTRSPQRVGVAQRGLQGVSAVRVRPTATFLRVTVEVGPPRRGDHPRPFARSHVRRSGRDIVLTVAGRPSGVEPGDLLATVDDPAFTAARVDVRDNPSAVVVTLTPRRSTSFWLHTLREPARVVLDIRR